jgi:hypothetical protein
MGVNCTYLVHDRDKRWTAGNMVRTGSIEWEKFLDWVQTSSFSRTLLCGVKLLTKTYKIKKKNLIWMTKEA